LEVSVTWVSLTHWVALFRNYGACELILTDSGRLCGSSAFVWRAICVYDGLDDGMLLEPAIVTTLLS
jgi:hypothetical protein